MKVGLVGPYPFPRGGMSVHIKRLEETLIAQGLMAMIINHTLLDDGSIKIKFNRIRWLMKFFTFKELDIIHIHLLDWKHIALIILIARIRKIKTIITCHSLRNDLNSITRMQKIYFSYALKKADYLISAGQNEKDKLTRFFNDAERMIVLPPFIPPKRVDTDIPEYITNFIRNHKFIISANGSNLNFYQGYEIYGLDMLVELSGRISTEMNVGFIYCLTTLTDQSYYDKIRARIKELKIEQYFLIVLESMEFWPILEKSHLFIRPACTDSYGISVAEALTLGIPSIASDVCTRPEGTVLFHNRDSKDLYHSVCEVIKNYAHYKDKTRNAVIENCTQTILKIYHDIMNTTDYKIRRRI